MSCIKTSLDSSPSVFFTVKFFVVFLTKWLSSLQTTFKCSFCQQELIESSLLSQLQIIIKGEHLKAGSCQTATVTMMMGVDGLFRNEATEMEREKLVIGVLSGILFLLSELAFPLWISQIHWETETRKVDRRPHR